MASPRLHAEPNSRADSTSVASRAPRRRQTSAPTTKEHSFTSAVRACIPAAAAPHLLLINSCSGQFCGRQVDARPEPRRPVHVPGRGVATGERSADTEQGKNKKPRKHSSDQPIKRPARQMGNILSLLLLLGKATFLSRRGLLSCTLRQWEQKHKHTSAQSRA